MQGEYVWNPKKENSAYSYCAIIKLFRQLHFQRKNIQFYYEIKYIFPIFQVIYF